MVPFELTLRYKRNHNAQCKNLFSFLILLSLYHFFFFIFVMAAHPSDLRDDTRSRASSVSTTPTENTPLLVSTKQQEEASWSTEFNWLFRNCLPVIGTYLLQNSLQLASIFTLGHLVSDLK